MSTTNKILSLLVFLAFMLQSVEAGNTHNISLPPHAKEGRLSNGLRYIILGNDIPRHNVECRLVMNVGSINEDDSQRGAAHFLEHMAFEGSRHFPGTSMVAYFERQGMKYGRDINAFTGFDRTVYWFTLPVNDSHDRIVDSTLVAMSNIIDSLTIAPDGVQAERGIIREELRGYNVDDNFYDLKNGYGRYAMHMPLGRDTDISAMQPSTLLDFYHKWYVPGNATVIVVGNVDPQDIERKINRYFGQLPKSPYGQIMVPKEYAPGVSMMTLQRDFQSRPKLELIIPHTYITKNNAKGYLESYRWRMLETILENRLSSDHISVSDAWYLADKSHMVITVEGEDLQAVRKKISKVSSALRQIATEGCRKDEMDWARSKIVSYIKAESTDKLSAEWCEDFIDYIIVHDKHLYSDKESYFLRSGISQMTSKEMKSVSRQLLKAAKAHMLCAVTLPASVKDTLSTASVRTAWETADAEDAPAFSIPSDGETEEHKTPVPDVLSEVHPDIHAIAYRKEYPNLGLTDIKLINGLHVLLRPTYEHSGQIHISVLGRGGLGDLPDTLYNRMKDAVAYVDMGGLSTVAPDTLTNIMIQQEMTMTVGIDNYWHQAIATAPTNHAQMLMNLLYEKMLHPGKDEAGFRESIREEAQSSGKPTTLDLMMKQDISRTIDNKIDSMMGNAVKGQFMEADSADIIHYSLDEMTDYYKRLFSNPKGLFLLVTGDFHKDDIASAAASTFGRMSSHDDPVLRNEPTSLPATPQELLYPSYDSTKVSCRFIIPSHYKPGLKQTLMFKLMRDLLQARMLSELRQKQNIVYSPYADVQYHGCPQQTVWFTLTIDVKRDNFLKLKNSLYRIFSDLGSSLVSKDELDKMKKSFIVTKRQVLTDIAPTEWKNAVEGLLRNGESLSDFDNYDEVLQSITPEDIRQEFKERVNREQTILFYQSSQK